MPERKQPWAKEPWMVSNEHVDHKCCFESALCNGDSAFDKRFAEFFEEADAIRAAACVSACAGVPTEELRRMKGIYNAAIQGIELVGTGKAAFAFVINHGTGRYRRYKVTIEGSCLREIKPEPPGE